VGQKLEKDGSGLNCGGLTCVKDSSDTMQAALPLKRIWALAVG
jgi:hypothetical protein